MDWRPTALRYGDAGVRVYEKLLDADGRSDSHNAHAEVEIRGRCGGLVGHSDAGNANSDLFPSWRGAAGPESGREATVRCREAASRNVTSVAGRTTHGQ